MINANIVQMELVAITFRDMRNVARNYILLGLSQKKEVGRSECNYMAFMCNIWKFDRLGNRTFGLEFI